MICYSKRQPYGQRRNCWQESGTVANVDGITKDRKRERDIIKNKNFPAKKKKKQKIEGEHGKM